MNQSLSRRQFLKSAAAGTAVAGLAAKSYAKTGQRADKSKDNYNVFFGDLHNHNSIGYAKGSLLRSFEIARNHLDFYAFTPHAWWHDVGHYVNNIEDKWLKGFEVTKKHWSDVLRLVKEFHKSGSFVTIPGYEWHSSEFGDYCLLFPNPDDAPYDRINELPELKAFAKKHRAIMIPHHPANFADFRGANFETRDPEVSPLLEIFSEWGNAESDRAQYPYTRHLAGRWTKNTLQYFLATGHRVGVLASSDDHLGFPGAYREGLAAVLVNELTREEIFDALWNRRTYGVSGDRIRLSFTLNEQVMGQELAYAGQRKLAVSATGWDQIDRVEVLKNNEVIHRDFPMDRRLGADKWNKSVLVRFEYGWGPWPALKMNQICDWDITCTIDNGILEEMQPCFQSGPFDEDRRDQIVEQSKHHLRVKSHTALLDMLEDVSQKAIVLKMRGGPNSRLTVKVETQFTASPVLISKTFKELAESSETLRTVDFPYEEAMLHRLVFQDRFDTSFTIVDKDKGNEVNWYYVRVVQANDQLAWSSPIWVEARG